MTDSQTAPRNSAAASCVTAGNGSWVVLHATREDGLEATLRLNVVQALELIRDLSHSIEEAISSD